MNQITREAAREALFGAFPPATREQALCNLLAMASVPDQPTYAPEALLRLGRLITELGAQDVEAGTAALAPGVPLFTPEEAVRQEAALTPPGA